jgi:hypothetical protein
MQHRSRPEYRAIVSISLLACLLPLPAQAQYLDPGAASVIVQAVVGTVVAGAAALKLYWHRVAAFFSRRRAGHDHAP